MKATKKIAPKKISEALVVSKTSTAMMVESELKHQKKSSLDFTYEYLHKNIEGFTTFDYDILKPHLKTLDDENFFGIVHLGKKVQDDLSDTTESLVTVVTHLKYDETLKIAKKKFWQKIDCQYEFHEMNKRVKELYRILDQNKRSLKTLLLKIQNNLKSIDKYNNILDFLMQEAIIRKIATKKELNQNMTLYERRFSLSSSSTIALHTQQNIDNLMRYNEQEMKLCEEHLNILKPSLENLQLISPRRFENRVKRMIR